MASIDLDQLLNLEERFSAVGHADGIRDGEQLGLVEGRSLGRQKGLELGLELGYYTAFAMEVDPSRYTSR
ncbi:hypothetical protein BDF22DRAFT_668311 [Syncephalis plumigaleata]|nr:hypothetical protein BDF22DRAFT_668311 [Syncephalis plumigaleata]